MPVGNGAVSLGKLLKLVFRRKFGRSRATFQESLGSCETISGWYAWKLVPPLRQHLVDLGENALGWPLCKWLETDAADASARSGGEPEFFKWPCPCPRGHPTVHASDHDTLTRLENEFQLVCFPPSMAKIERGFAKEAGRGDGSHASASTCTEIPCGADCSKPVVCRTCSLPHVYVTRAKQGGGSPAPFSSSQKTIEAKFCCMHCRLYECGPCVQRRLDEFEAAWHQERHHAGISDGVNGSPRFNSTCTNSGRTRQKSQHQSFSSSPALRDFSLLDERAASQLSTKAEFIQYLRNTRVGTYNAAIARDWASAHAAEKRNLFLLFAG